MAWYLMFNFSMDCKVDCKGDKLVSREFIKLENIPEINNPEEYKRAVIDARSRWSNLQFTCKGSICSVSDSELVWREVLEIEEEKMDSMAEALLIPHKQREFEKRREALVHDPDPTAEQ